ncbi:hypothetical protein DYB31_006658 [Aphanomyces astaci]|uniref:Uncharacterized protein n=2 Tax=Aphanomyces astaci TaxID=112090 RepID=A0A397FBV7_APHAT|nr:hypothetical protein DYB31_006658 [Aphanomyces astaci]
MISVSLARLFSSINPGDNKEAVRVCDSLRKDMHSCYLHHEGRQLIFQFNSKAKAATWRNQPVPFRGQITWLRHFRCPEDPTTDLDTEETQQTETYSFPLLQVPARIKLMQVLHMLRLLGVGVVSLDTAKNQGTGDDDANSYLVVTDKTDVPDDILGKSCIQMGPITVHIFHFQDYTNMPCRRCAALDHQVERCPAPDLHRDKIITLSQTLWAASPNTEFIGKPSFAQWLRDVGAHIPPMPVGTQTAPSVASHGEGTQAVQQADYGTSPETHTCDGSVQTDHFSSLTETTTSTGQYTAAPTPPTQEMRFPRPRPQQPGQWPRKPLRSRMRTTTESFPRGSGFRPNRKCRRLAAPE